MQNIWNEKNDQEEQYYAEKDGKAKNVHVRATVGLYTNNTKAVLIV